MLAPQISSVFLIATTSCARPPADEDLFAAAVLNTASFVVTQVAVMIGVSLMTAVVLNGRIKVRGFFRSVFFYPVLLSPIVVALIWRWMLQENGLFNAIIVSLGGEKLRFLTDRNWARFWVVMVSVWSFMGFYTLILLAGLQAIPADLYEAAAIDGASSWLAFRSITLPLLAPTMLVVIVLSTIRAVQIFDVVFAFTGGGPGSATLYIVHYIYTNGFASPFREYGLAAATSLVMAAVLIVLTIIQIRVQGTGMEDEDDGKKKVARRPALSQAIGDLWGGVKRSLLDPLLQLLQGSSRCRRRHSRLDIRYGAEAILLHLRLPAARCHRHVWSRALAGDVLIQKARAILIAFRHAFCLTIRSWWRSKASMSRCRSTR